MKEALFYAKTENGAAVCGLCPRGCVINDGKTGICLTRRNTGGVLYAEGYGQVSSLALDPVAKKPLNHLYPDGKVLSLGGYGCNLKCPFCQNHAISMEKPECEYIPPEGIAALAVDYGPAGNIGAAYTYNEPFINFEYVYDCAVLVKENGMKNVFVTNGFISPDAFNKILPYIDAMNIDLKSFNDNFYKNIGGDLAAVKAIIQTAVKNCHVEITTLIIPGENDGEDEMESIAKWIASVDKNCPLHVNRFTPRYKMADKTPTPRATIDRLYIVAKNYINFVHKGNI